MLGPVRAWLGNAEVHLGSPQQRAALAVLLLADGRQVSMAALVDALWGSEPPKAAVATVRTYIWRLRQRLANDPADGALASIESAGDGYVLPVRPSALDLGLFLHSTAEARRARSSGDLDRAATLLRDALALWTGTPLAGLPGDYAERQRVRLSELRLAAAEERLALDIDLGGHVTAAAELRTLLADHPLREKLTELLMLALYRAGRQAEALSVFGTARHTLNENLGIDPGPALQDLHQRILRTDEALMPLAIPQTPATATSSVPEVGTSVVPLVTPAQLPADLPAFTGRQAELAELNALLDTGSARDSAATIEAIDGIAGIGKTTLAVHWAHQVADQFPDGQLYVNLHGFDPGQNVTTPDEALRGFLEALGLPTQRIPRGLEARSGLFRSLLHGRRVMLLLDNARDAEQIRPLIPASPGCLVIITSRHQLIGLNTTHDARTLSVGAFSPDEARDHLARRIGHGRLAAEPAALREIVHWCAGLPLATALIAARAIASPQLPLTLIASELREERTRLDALSVGDTAADVRAVFSSSYRLLTPAASQLFILLSLHGGREFSRHAAAVLVGMPEAEVRPLMAELSRTRLVTEYHPGQFSSHDLIRLYGAELDHYLHAACPAPIVPRPDFVAPGPAAARLSEIRKELPACGQAPARAITARAESATAEPATLTRSSVTKRTSPRCWRKSTQEDRMLAPREGCQPGQAGR